MDFLVILAVVLLAVGTAISALMGVLLVLLGLSSKDKEERAVHRVLFLFTTIWMMILIVLLALF